MSFFFYNIQIKPICARDIRVLYVNNQFIYTERMGKSKTQYRTFQYAGISILS